MTERMGEITAEEIRRCLDEEELRDVIGDSDVLVVMRAEGEGA